MAPKDRPTPLAGSLHSGGSTAAATTPSGKPLPPRQRKIALLGSRSVGKSSLAVQFCENHFVESYYPTIEESFTKEFKYKGKEYQLEIQDTAGHDEFSLLNAKYAVGWHGYIIIYSVASRASFEMVPIIRDKVLSYSGVDKMPMCIVGNKSDLEVQRTVTTEQGREMAKKLGCAFTEASAKHNDNVISAFQLLVAEIEKELNPESARSQSSGTSGSGSNSAAGGRGDGNGGANGQSWGNWFKGVFGGNPNSASAATTHDTTSRR